MLTIGVSNLLRCLGVKSATVQLFGDGECRILVADPAELETAERAAVIYQDGGYDVRAFYCD